LNKKNPFSSLLKVIFLVLIAIVLFEYAEPMRLPGLTVFYTHLIGIVFGVMVIGFTVYRIQTGQEKLLAEKIEETERRIQSEASFRNVEENYRRLFLDSMDGVCKTTLDGKIVEANRAFCDILGCDADKIIGESIIQFYDNPEDRKQFRDVIEKNKGIKNYEIIQKRVDGTRIICSISSSFFYSQERKPEGYLTILRDITDRKRAEQEMAIFAEIGHVIGSTMNINEVFERFAAEAKKLIPFDRIAVNLCNIRTNIATVAYVSGADLSNHKQGDSFPLRGSVTNEFLRTRTGRIIQSEKMDAIVRRIPSFSCAVEAGLRSIVGVPLIYKDEAVGVLQFRSKTPNAYSDQDLHLAERIGAQIAGAIANAQLFTDIQNTEKELIESEKRYRELSIIDDLTQLYNSRHFHFHLKNELERSNRYGQPLTLLLLDLDNFKLFNDTYGHVEGDQVLWRLGQVVKRCLRETDFAYRYGGEEFTVLLPMTTRTEGFVTAERIRTEFRKETFSPAPGQDVHVTVSIGLAQYRPPEEMKAFVHRVDQLMYQGKKEGKDRVCGEPSSQERYEEQSWLPF
jgi:diguanylate cyclase (GGDEF)-like protein/PAS domain S-box-containing protein